MAGTRGPGGNLDGRETAFLALYYGTEAPTKGDVEESARAAGYPEASCEAKGRAILRKYEDFAFRMAARAVGITKPYLAFRVKKILELDERKHSKDVLSAIRMCLTNMGEFVEQPPSSANGGNTFTGPVMVIQGMTHERMKALKEAIPPPTILEVQKRQDEEDARAGERLERFKRGELEPLWRNPQPEQWRQMPDDQEEPFSDQHEPNVEGDRKTPA